MLLLVRATYLRIHMQLILASQMDRGHPDISLPSDVEHFLHVGATNINNIHTLCTKQQDMFQSVAKKRARMLPKIPKNAIRISDDNQSKMASTSSATTTTTTTSVASPNSSFLSSTTTTTTSTTVSMRRKGNSTSRLTPSASNRLSSSSTASSSRLTPMKGKGLIGRLKGEKTKSSLVDHFQHIEMFFVDAAAVIGRDDVTELNALINKNNADINQVNDDGHTLLDIAVMLNSPGCVKLLMLHGGVEKESYADPSERQKGMEILHQAKQIATANIASDLMTGKTDQYSFHSETKSSFELFDKLYRKWNVVRARAGLPSAPQRVRLKVTGADRVQLHISEAADPGGAPVTRYKVLVSGDRSFTDTRVLFVPSTVSRLTLKNLPEGREVYVRVCSVNVRGIGPAVSSRPLGVIPQSTRSLPPPFKALRQSVEAVQASMEEKGLLDFPSSLSSKFGSSLKLTKPSKKGLYVCVCAYDESNPSSICAVSNALPCVRVNAEMHVEDIHEAIKFLQLLSFSWSSAALMENFTSEISTVSLRKSVAECVVFMQSLFHSSDLGHVYYNVVHEEQSDAHIVVTALPLSSSFKLPGTLTWTQTSALKTSQSPSLCSSVNDIIEFSVGCSAPMDDGDAHTHTCIHACIYTLIALLVYLRQVFTLVVCFRTMSLAVSACPLRSRVQTRSHLSSFATTPLCLVLSGRRCAHCRRLRLHTLLLRRRKSCCRSVPLNNIAKTTSAYMATKSSHYPKMCR
eukprot:m.79048 g.79048  ORF g.79048 m.79048 type:complete len:744 (+) comp11975_c1_seq8:82-2313(+)